jgi:hypothetical protein
MTRLPRPRRKTDPNHTAGSQAARLKTGKQAGAPRIGLHFPVAALFSFRARTCREFLPRRSSDGTAYLGQTESIISSRNGSSPVAGAPTKSACGEKIEFTNRCSPGHASLYDHAHEQLRHGASRRLRERYVSQRSAKTVSVTSGLHKRGHSNAIAEQQRRPGWPVG